MGTCKEGERPGPPPQAAGRGAVGGRAASILLTDVFSDTALFCLMRSVHRRGSSAGALQLRRRVCSLGSFRRGGRAAPRGARGSRSRARAILLPVAALLACGETPPQHTWTDLFDVRDPVALSEDFLQSIEADTLQTRFDRDASRWRLSGRTGPRVSVAGLRAGRLERPFGQSGGSAMLGGMARYGRDLGASLLDKPRIVYEVPYWVSLPYAQVAAVGGGRIFVASNLFYPIFIHDYSGRLLDSLTVPPPSWRGIRRTERGEFSNDRAGDSAFAAFLETFTSILDMAVVADSVLVVNHGAYRRDGENVLRIRPTASDVYVNGVRVASDLPSPGEVLAYSQSSVFFLTGGPPDSEWRLTEYVWRDP